jgi:hypothetical protein
VTLPEFLEQHLGQIAEGWVYDDGPTVRVVRFPDQPTDGITTFTTLGLSDHVLRLPSGDEVRQEFIFPTRAEYPPNWVASFLGTLTQTVLRKHWGLARGEFIGPSDPLIPGATANAVYASIPVIYPDAVRVYSGASSPVVLVWLVPITEGEVNYIKTHGWDAFESLLENDQPDLFDLRRPGVV